VATARSSGSIRLYADSPQLTDFVRAIRQVEDRGIHEAVADEFDQVSRLMAQRSRAASPDRLASAIRPVATQTSASVRTSPTSRAPDALARFWGTKRRTGWYGWRRYNRSDGEQFDRWVGNRWAPGSQAGMPYHIGEPINRTTDEIPERLGERLERLFT
jgi:hypothetical protein